MRNGRLGRAVHAQRHGPATCRRAVRWWGRRLTRGRERGRGRGGWRPRAGARMYCRIRSSVSCDDVVLTYSHPACANSSNRQSEPHMHGVPKVKELERSSASNSVSGMCVQADTWPLADEPHDLHRSLCVVAFLSCAHHGLRVAPRAGAWLHRIRCRFGRRHASVAFHRRRHEGCVQYFSAACVSPCLTARNLCVRCRPGRRGAGDEDDAEPDGHAADARDDAGSAGQGAHAAHAGAPRRRLGPG
eukprot:6514562-Prymnesium_polylepis.1